MKVEQGANPPLEKAPKKTTYEYRSRPHRSFPVEKKAVDWQRAVKPPAETLKTRERLRRQGIRRGSIRDARKNRYCGSGKAFPRHRDLT